MLKKRIPESHWTKLSVLALASALTACGGSSHDAPDALQVYRDQKLAWAACDAALLDSEQTQLAEQLGSRMQCVKMRVPKDWAKPENGDIQIAVLRVAAGDSKARRGAIAFNPGGPGEEGLTTGLDFFSVFSISNSASEQGAAQLRLVNEYDFVGFSPRGVGASTALKCETDEAERFVDQSPTGALTPTNWDNAMHNSREIANACRSNPLTPYINTDATARDLDLLRELLGDAKLNYFGYSYGTWLGGWYASLFPDKVGRMVLDSSEDFTSTHEATTLAMAPARARIFEQVLIPYAVRHADFFNLGNNASEINILIQSLSPQMQDVLTDVLGDKTYKSRIADNYLGLIGAARGLDSVLATMSHPENAGAVKAALATHTFIPGNAERDALVRTGAFQIYAAAYRPRWLAREDEPAEFGAVLWAVNCNDTPATTDEAIWFSKVKALAQQAPMEFSIGLTNPCATWGGPSVTKPNVTAMSGLDILMVQSQFDGATPLEGADRYFAALGAAKRIYVPNEYDHAVFPYADPTYTDTCVDSGVVRYLLGESPKQRETICKAKPLPQDPKVQTAAIPMYLNPEQAQSRIDALKDKLSTSRR